MLNEIVFCSWKKFCTGKIKKKLQTFQNIFGVPQIKLLSNPCQGLSLMGFWSYKRCMNSYCRCQNKKAAMIRILTIERKITQSGLDPNLSHSQSTAQLNRKQSK